MKKRIAGVTASMVAAGMLFGLSNPVPTSAETISGSQQVISTQTGQQRTDEQRLALLEYAIQPESAEAAIDLFVKSYEIRNGALLFAALSPQLQKQVYPKFAESHWVIGGSSPWVKGFRIVGTKEIDAGTMEYQLHLLEYTSTGFMGVESVVITVKKHQEKWLIDKYTPLQFKTNLDLMNNKLTEDTLKGLLTEAQTRYWYIAVGGKGSNSKPSFTPQGMEGSYRWLSEDIGTKEKMTRYLGEIYSDEAVASFWKDQLARKMIVEEAGELAQPDGDYGSLKDWSAIKINKLEQKDQKATATIQIPVGDQGYEAASIELVYMKNAGWRIATAPQNIR